MTAYQKTFERLKQHARQTALWVTTESALGWDERTMMPSAGAEFRAEQITLLAGTIHARRTDPRAGPLAGRTGRQPAGGRSDQRRRARRSAHLKRHFDKRVKLPQIAGRRAGPHRVDRASTSGRRPARTNDFVRFEPVLAKMFELKRAQAEALGYAECPTTRCWTITSRAKRRPTWPACWPELRGAGAAGGGDRRQRAAARRDDPDAALSRGRAEAVWQRGGGSGSDSIFTAGGWT